MGCASEPHVYRATASRGGAVLLVVDAPLHHQARRDGIAGVRPLAETAGSPDADFAGRPCSRAKRLHLRAAWGTRGPDHCTVSLRVLCSGCGGIPRFVGSWWWIGGSRTVRIPLVVGAPWLRGRHALGLRHVQNT